MQLIDWIVLGSIVVVLILARINDRRFPTKTQIRKETRAWKKKLRQ